MSGRTSRSIAADGPYGAAGVAHRVADRREGGATLVLTAILLVILFAIGYVGVNWAVAVSARVSVQRAADAAALAGCLDLPDADKAVASAQRYGASAGGLNANASYSLESGQGDQSVTATVDSDGTQSVRTGPDGQPITLQNNRITVIVRRTQWLFGIPNWPPLDRIMPVAARAVCVRNEGAQPVLHVLSIEKDGLTIESSTLIWPTGGIVVGRADCSPNRQMKVTGVAQVRMKYIDVCSGAAGCGEQCQNMVWPWPVNDDFLDDPYRNVPEPNPADFADYRNRCPAPGVMQNPGRICQFTSGTVPPGLYNGLVLGSQSGGGSVTLAQGGRYYLAGRGLVVNDTTTVTGDEIFIFNGASSPGGSDCGSVSIEHDANLQITPQSSGTYKELLIFQARACSGPQARTFVDSGVTIGLKDGPWGTLYLAGARADIGCRSCTKTIDVNVRVVAYEIYLTGPINFADIKIPSGNVKHGDIHLVE